MEYVKKLLHTAENFKLYPRIRTASTPPGQPVVTIDGKEVLTFCSNNYLGMGYHPTVIKAAIEAAQKYGTSCGGSRLISGNIDLAEELEREIAAFKSAEAAILFMTGFMANTGVLTSVMNVPNLLNFPLIRQDQNLILSDELNHASIVDGCRLCKAPRIIYKHKDMKDLEKALKKNKSKRKLIVTDGVFSMDGDIAPLPQIVELAQRYKAMVMVDDAHATGVLGKNGGGTVDHFNLEGKIDIVMGTFSKSLGGVGGFVVGSNDLVRFLRIRAREYIFTSALPPATVGGILAALKEIKAHPELRQNLLKNVTHLKNGLKELGFNTLESETQIIPILIGSEDKAIKMSDLLFEEGIFVPCVRWPAVSQGKSRLRTTVMATHTEDQINRALEAFKKVGKQLNII